jgi:dolichol-phosphate mannosyltransferase
MRQHATAELRSPAPAAAHGRAVPPAVRLRAELRRGANWLQLVRFGIVGASGYGVNIATFTVMLHVRHDHRLAAFVAFLVAVTNNFIWNRHWTFAGAGGRASRQAVRFLIVSGAAFGLNLGLLELILATTAAPEIAAQAIAVLAAMPVSFLANKLWSFRA